MWKKEKKKLEALGNTINDLKATIKNLKGQLVNSKILRGHYKTYNWDPNQDIDPISLIDLKNQIDGIKDFLGIEFVTKPAVESESYMKKTPVVGASTRS